MGGHGWGFYKRGEAKDKGDRLERQKQCTEKEGFQHLQLSQGVCLCKRVHGEN